jgi:two-component system alkaline phosphatase synthesis response regulator PhoP
VPRTKTKSSILIIEDDPKYSKMLELALRNEGFEIIRASDGMLGLTLNKVGHPDLIITDLAMPHMDGYEMIEKIRENRYLCKIPIVVISGVLDRDVKGEPLKELKAEAVFSKPFNMANFLKTVKKLLKS